MISCYTILQRLKPRSHQQQCRSNIVQCYKSNDSFDKVECCFDKVEGCFDIVAVSWQQCRSFVLSTMSKRIEHDEISRKTSSTLLPKMAVTRSKQHSTLLKGRNFTINSFDIVVIFGNKFKCCFDKVERCFDIVACCFNIVAG